MQSEQIQILRNYKIHLKIPFGSGVSGNVYFCEDTQNIQLKLVAKVIFENIHPEAALNEFEVLEIIRDNPNKNLVKIYYVEWDKQNCKLYTIMERCQINLKIHGNLGTKFTQQESINLLKQLVNGYKTLYENDIIHRDLKPSNILVEKCDIQTQYKICDFGISKKIKNEDYIIKIGTPYYCAPEINSNHMSLKLEQDFLECSKNFKKTINVCDMYSLGILMYELIVGELPHKKFNYNKIEEFYKTLNNGSFKMKAEVSEDLISLIMKMIQYYPSKRLKFDELLNHPLIREDQSQPKNSHNIQLKNSQQSSDQAQKIKFTNINPKSKEGSIFTTGSTIYNYIATPQNTYNYNNYQLENENQIRKLVKIEAKEEYKFQPKQEYEFQPKKEYEFQLKKEYEFQPKQEYEFQPKQEYEFQPKQEYEFQPKQEFLQFNIQKQKTAEEIIQEGPRKQVKCNAENQIDQKTLAIDYFNQLLFQAEKLMTEQSIKHITELIQGLQNFDKEQTKAIININLYLPSRSIQSEKTSYSKFRDLFDPYYAKLRKYDISNELIYDNTSKNPSQFIKNNTFIQEKYQQNQQTYQSKFSNQLIVIENKDRLIIQDYFEDLLHQIQLMIQSKAKQYLIEFLEELKSNVCKAQTILQIYNLLPNRDVFKEKKNYSQFRNIFEEICKKNMIIIQ